MPRSSFPLREVDDSFLDEVTTRYVLEGELRALVEETREPKQRAANQGERTTPTPVALLDRKRVSAHPGPVNVSSHRDHSAAFARSTVGIPNARAAFVPVEVVQAVLDCATGYLGPAARPILAAELRRLGATAQTLPWRLVAALINGLGSHLDTTRSAVEFSRSVQLAHQGLHAYWDIPTR
jgi:hypothetical protein